MPFEPAQSGRRVVAYLIDLALFVLVVGVVTLPIGSSIAGELALFLGVAALDLALTTTLGTTAGKRLAKLRVSQSAGSFARPTIWQASRRVAVKWAVPFTVFYGLLAILWLEPTGAAGSRTQLWILNIVGVPGLLFPLVVLVTIVGSKHHRGWHDYFGGTYVLREVRRVR